MQFHCGQIMVSDDGNIVNLSSFRKISREEKKKAAKKQKEQQAAANRVRFGRTGAEKKRTQRENNKTSTILDGKQLASHPTSPEKPEE